VVSLSNRGMKVANAIEVARHWCWRRWTGNDGHRRADRSRSMPTLRVLHLGVGASIGERASRGPEEADRQRLARHVKSWTSSSVSARLVRELTGSRTNLGARRPGR